MNYPAVVSLYNGVTRSMAGGLSSCQFLFLGRHVEAVGFFEFRVADDPHHVEALGFSCSVFYPSTSRRPVMII